MFARAPRASFPCLQRCRAATPRQVRWGPRRRTQPTGSPRRAGGLCTVRLRCLCDVGRGAVQRQTLRRAGSGLPTPRNGQSDCSLPQSPGVLFVPIDESQNQRCNADVTQSRHYGASKSSARLWPPRGISVACFVDHLTHLGHSTRTFSRIAPRAAVWPLARPAAVPGPVGVCLRRLYGPPKVALGHLGAVVEDRGQRKPARAWIERHRYPIVLEHHGDALDVVEPRTLGELRERKLDYLAHAAILAECVDDV